MIHRAIRRQLPLLLYGELQGWKARRVQRHIARCHSCRTEYEEFCRLHSLLGTAEPDTVSEADLGAARRTLLSTISSFPPAQSGRSSTIGRLLPPLGFQRRWNLSGAALTLAGAAVGFFIAVLFWHSEERQTSLVERMPQEQIRIENIRFLDYGAKGEELELTLEAVRPFQVRGSAEDPEIQRLLARAVVSDRNPGVRLRAVSVLGTPAPQPVDPEIRRALLTAMTTDENAGVRMAALEAVRQLPLDHEGREALLHVLLYDVNPGLRIAAINALEERLRDFTGEDEAALRDRMGELETDDNAYVRWKARTVLLERGAL